MDKSITITFSLRQQAAMLDCINSWQRHLGDHDYSLVWIARYAQALHEIKQQLEPNDSDSVE